MSLDPYIRHQPEPEDASRANVMHVLTRLSVGGVGPHVLSLSRDLGRYGYRTKVISGSPSANEVDLPARDVDHVSLPRMKREVSPRDDAACLIELRRRFRRERPEIVHTHMAKAGLLGRLAARGARVPVVVHTFHGHVLNNYFSVPVSAAFAVAEKQLGRISDACIAVSSSVRDDLLGRGIGVRSKWHVIPPGLPEVDLFANMPDPKAARATLGLPPDVPIVGIAARFVPVKALDTFLYAAAHISREMPNVHFAIAGEGELRGELEPIARRALGSNVTFLGWVEDLKSLYSSLDVIVLTSLNEGTPVSLIEAGAAGKPCVATDVGGVSDVLVDQVTGLLVHNVRDPRAIARRVLELLENPMLARRMGDSGRLFVRARFSHERMVKNLAELYEDLLESKG